MRLNTAAWNRVRYTLYAPLYDRVVGSLGLFRRGRRRALELAELRPGERVLLVAAGTGLDLELLPPGVEVVATDIAPAMVARIRARAERLGRPVEAEVMDAAALAYPDAGFDCVMLHLALAVVPDPVAAVREAARVLKPGGRVSVFDKFLPGGRRAGLPRRVLNRVAGALFTELNRELEPLLRAGGLRLSRLEPAGAGGNFVVARAEKPEEPA